MEKKRKERKGSYKGIAVSADFGARLKDLRVLQGKTRSELEQATGLSGRTISDIERGARTHFSEDTLIRIARGLGVSLNDLLKPTFGLRTTIGSVLAVASDASTVIPHVDFYTLQQFAHEVDNYLLSVLRDHRVAKFDVINREYCDLLTLSFAKRKLTPDSFLTALTNPTTLGRLQATLPLPDLTVHVNASFNQINFSFNDRKIRVRNPRLVWDCHCETPLLADCPQRIAYTCPIHAHAVGGELTSRFLSGHVLLTWRGLMTYWSNAPEFWPPSVDTFRMLQNLEREGVFRDPVRTVLDLGCGTGMLGIAVAARNPHVIQLDLADWLVTPVFYAATNWALNRVHRTHVSANARLGLYTDWVTSSQDERPYYDLVLCNPPYLPILPGFEALGSTSTVAGTDLLVHAIINAKSLGQRVYLQFSDLAIPEAQGAANSAGVHLRRIGNPHDVPFRVSTAYDHPAYLRRLVDERGLRFFPEQRHVYWPRVTTYLLE